MILTVPSQKEILENAPFTGFDLIEKSMRGGSVLA
jgi:hypothetical protein